MVRNPELHRYAALVAVAAGAVLAWGCAGAQARCGSLDACSATSVCEVGRCVPSPEPPVAETTRRLVLAPVALRYDDDGSRSADARFGSARGGGSDLLVRFAPTWGKARVERAYLLIEPAAAAPPTSEPVPVTVARVLSAWSETGSFPRLAPSEVSAPLSVVPGGAARIDVTELVRAGAATEHGLDLHASGGDGLGARFATESVRLDVYVR